jgi:hypothetical protein
MSHLIPTTIEIAAFRKLGRSVDARWVDWAVRMLELGADSDSICSLAGAFAPFNSFEMAELVDNALQDLDAAPIPSAASAARTITAIRAKQVLEGKLPIDIALAELSQLCIELDYLSDIYDFYLLHFAKEDLKFSDQQWYWSSATKENIDQVVTEHLQNWIAEHPIGD